MPYSRRKSVSGSHPISIAVLVGGASSRMGEDKGMTLLRGRPMVSYVLKALRPLSDDLFLVGKEASAYERIGLPVHVDRYSSHSSLVGILSAVDAARERYCLVAPCDMPFITTGLARLMAAHVNGFDAVVPEGDTGREPLFAIYAKSCLGAMARHITEGRMKLADLLDYLAVRRVTRREVEGVCDPVRAFFNVNSPEDLAEAESMLEIQKEPPSSSGTGNHDQGITPLVSFVGNKNSGKTGFVERLIALLTARGLRVASIKHDVHGFSIDREGTDTWRFREAGAARVMISAPGQMAMFERVQGERQLDELRELAGAGMDIILVEGFKSTPADKIEVHGNEDPESLVCAQDELIALISDRPVPGVGLSSFRHCDVEAIADLIIERYGLKSSFGA